jgi:hypothetical protein
MLDIQAIGGVAGKSVAQRVSLLIGHIYDAALDSALCTGVLEKAVAAEALCGPDDG